MKIGFFDSGLGGIVILKAVVKHLPGYDYVYVGDTANIPYGDKTEEEIYELTKTGIVRLFEEDCLLVIVACNTASAETLRRLQDTFLKEEYPERKVLGVIVPTLEVLIDREADRAILLATKRTVESNKYYVELQKLAPNISLTSIAAPELVPLIETHKLDEATKAAQTLLEETAVGKGDVVILGCTHYTLLKDNLQERFPDVRFLSQDEIIPEKVSNYLSQHPEIAARLTNTGERKIHLTAHKPEYDQLAAEFLNGVYVSPESQV